jgi:hypothetical protein
MTADLTREERFLLVWLAREDRNQLGECNGKSLDRLVDLGLAHVERMTGVEPEYWNVHCSEEGYQLAAMIDRGLM